MEKELESKKDETTDKKLNISDVSTSIKKKCQKPEDYKCVKLYGGCCRDLNCEYWY